MSAVQQLGRVPYQPQGRPRSIAEAFPLPGLPSSLAAAFATLPFAAAGGLVGLQEVGGTAVPASAPAAPGTGPIQGATSGGFVAAGYDQFIGRSTGSGQCVALVQAASPGIGLTRGWTCGDAVQGNTALRPGTVIATFDASNRYANATDGSSHAAIYLGQSARGIQVLDQWAGSPAAVRTIPWTNPSGVAANSGTAFHVVHAAG